MMSMFLVWCGLILLSCSMVMSIETFGEYSVSSDDGFELWPPLPVHNAISKRQAGQAGQPATVQSEGGGQVEVKAQPAVPVPSPTPAKPEDKGLSSNDKAVPATNNTVAVVSAAPPVQPANTLSSDTKPTPTALDLNKPGVVKRGAIVFGGFLMLAVAYYVFYRKSNTKKEANNQSTGDANQFRYGVLQSDDRRDNLELSQIPLTMESDDDDDEDLEIFDLGQKKKSLSYVNLQTNDADLVFSNSSRDEDRNNMLLDIEDETTDTLINWSQNGNKSIL